MKFVKCKTETEKLNAILDYCTEQINENNYKINWLKNEQNSPLDYADEIHEYKTRISHFTKLIEIIQADEFTSIMIF